LATMLCMIVGHSLLFFYLICVTFHGWVCSKTYSYPRNHQHAQGRVQAIDKRVSPRPSPSPPPPSASTTTSLWMYPHYGNEEWKRLPLVPYDSYTEYRTLRSAISQEYAAMVQKVLYGILYGAVSDSPSGISMHKEMMKPWHLMCNGFRDYITDAWIKEGKDVFLVFTKGVDEAWCHAMSVYFALRLNTAVKVFVSHHRSFQLQSLSELSFDFFRQEIFDFMCREIEGYVLEGDFNPYDRVYTFEQVNFTHLCESNPKPLSILTEESDSIFKILEDHYRIIPTGRFQDMMFAFAMGTHTRNVVQKNDNSGWPARPLLSKKNQNHCLLSMLTDDILRIIFRDDIFHHGETQPAFI
jgi:hypothetical protein